MKNFLEPDQLEAVSKMKNGCILNGGTGSGKSLTGLYYYFTICGGKITDQYYRMTHPLDLYIITTAKKRDSGEWEKELHHFTMSSDPELNIYKNQICIDSWNNIKKYTKAYGCFFIFDEDRVTGSGAWVKSFLKIANKNKWIILSATPGDCWMDYWAVFVANGFYKNKTDFINQHVIYKRFVSYPQIDRYVGVKLLEEYRDDILIPIHYESHTTPHHIDVMCNYDAMTYKILYKDRWNVYENKPIETAAELYYLQRKVTNSDPSRLNSLIDICKDHDKVIVFYSFDYELDIIMSIVWDRKVAQWNGHKHQPVPETEKWIYLVQYTAGCEGWNCISTNVIVFYSQQYSYKVFSQACGRIDRRNTPFDDLYYYHLKSTARIDIEIARAIKNKKNFNLQKYTNKYGFTKGEHYDKTNISLYKLQEPV